MNKNLLLSLSDNSEKKLTKYYFLILHNSATDIAISVSELPNKKRRHFISAQGLQKNGKHFVLKSLQNKISHFEKEIIGYRK